MIIEIVLSHLDFLLIENIRRVRLNAKLSQTALAHKIGVSEGFIGNVENHNQPNKLNIRLLSRIAIACNLKSYEDIFPKEATIHDLVKIRIQFFDTEALVKQHKINGEPLERFKIISVSPLTDRELESYKANKINYRTIIKS
jgi:transcriptional regulator with XRE-family HTH domain